MVVVVTEAGIIVVVETVHYPASSHLSSSSPKIMSSDPITTHPSPSPHSSPGYILFPITPHMHFSMHPFLSPHILSTPYKFSCSHIFTDFSRIFSDRRNTSSNTVIQFYITSTNFLNACYPVTSPNTSQHNLSSPTFVTHFPDDS